MKVFLWLKVTPSEENPLESEIDVMATCGETLEEALANDEFTGDAPADLLKWCKSNEPSQTTDIGDVPMEEALARTKAAVVALGYFIEAKNNEAQAEMEGLTRH